MTTPTAGSLMAPLLLRLVIGLTFVWAGLGKLTTEMQVSGQAAATLANMGVMSSKLEPIAEPEMTDPAATTPDRQPVPTEPLTPASGNPGIGPKKPDSAPTETIKPGQSEKPKSPSTPSTPLMQVQSAPSSESARVYVASDFPEPKPVMGLYGLALLVHNSAVPPPSTEVAVDGQVETKSRALLPRKLGEGRWPVYLAWAAAITEVVGGVALLAGLFTRLAAFGLAGTMVVAAWLTQIGPAMLSGTGKLGMLPTTDWYARDVAGNPTLAVLGWQLSLLAGCAALVFLGGGYLSLDRLLFPQRGYVAEKVVEVK